MSSLFQVAAEKNDLETFEQPPRWFRESLTEMLAAAMQECGACKGWIRAPGFNEIQLYGEPALNGDLPQPCLSARLDRAGGACLPSERTTRSLADRTLGPFTLISGSLCVPEMSAARLDAVARNAESLIAKYQVYLFAARELGIDISSIVLGSSASLQSLEVSIAKIARSDLPVLIHAEFGSDVIAVAATAHCMSRRQRGPFVVLGCACQRPEDFRRSLSSAVEEAAGGSLLLSEVDLLEDAMQKDLLGLLASPDCAIKAGRTRLLSAANRPLDELVRDGRFSRLLYVRLELLKLEVPPLRARRDDIRPLVEYEISERLNSSKWLSKEAMKTLEEYPWPGNLGELRQAVSRMVVMSDSECIAIEDLAAHSALLGQIKPAASAKLPAPADGEERAEESPVADIEEGVEQGVEAIAQLARSLAVGNPAGLAQYGVGLQRALTFVSQRYQSEISLTELAESAYLSASHLSFLFKKMLGVPFKTLLAMVRIEKAKQLLAESPDLSVTEVSLDAGFGDLSHFERTFKRIVGLNPRAFRRKWSTQPSPGSHVLSDSSHANGARRIYFNESRRADAENRNPRQVFEIR